MPKFTYSAAKGIEQSNGSGFIIQNVPISRSIVDSGTALTTTGTQTITDTEEVLVLDLAGSHTVNLPAGGSVGEQKIVIFESATGNATISGNTINAPSAGDVVMLVWNGSAWKVLS